MYPASYRTVDYVHQARMCTDTHTSRFAVTPSGHVLVAASITSPSGTPPIAAFASKMYEHRFGNEILFVDTTKLFTSQVPCFTCFVTGGRHNEAYAVRIEDTAIWLLVSNCKDLVWCNELTSRIDRREFKEIQTGFLRLLLSHYQELPQ